MRGRVSCVLHNCSYNPFVIFCVLLEFLYNVHDKQAEAAQHSIDAECHLLFDCEF